MRPVALFPLSSMWESEARLSVWQIGQDRDYAMSQPEGVR